ncbi:MAG: hypothetical protein A3K83_05315 [Omnitrophica WOR_2 bacterium RBG_13_44_8b]|nr:MAG: hypothetical protein A3K83_05315 [Omnitrophica WOR_2 bacterium RBG_13_44_8b]
MNLTKNIIISKKLLLEHKMRTILSLSGIIIGVCSVIIMVSIGRGTEEKVVREINKMGENLLIVNAGQVKIIAGRQRQTQLVTTLELRDAEDISARASNVNYAVPAQQKKLQVKYAELSTKTNVAGTTTDIQKAQNYSLRKGRFFDEDENKGSRRVAVVGQTVVENIFEEEDPIGKTIRIGKVPFEVIGVLSSKGLDIYGKDQDDQIFIPIKTALRRLFNLTYINAIYVQVENADAMSLAQSEITFILRERHHIKKDKPDDFTIQNQSLMLETQRESKKTFTLLTSSIAAISLLVGGIGILAVMLISIKERIQEIGIRRAVGAKKKDILVQFLAEALLLSTSGGLIGILLGITASVITSIFADWPLIIPLNLIIVSFLSAFVIGIFFGVYPAKKAANLDPIKALQFE